MNGTLARVVDRKTLIPLGLVVAIVAPLASGVWGASKFWYKMDAIEKKLDTYIDMSEDRWEKNWTRDDMRHWADLLEARTGLNVPPATHYRGLVEMGNE